MFSLRSALLMLVSTLVISSGSITGANATCEDDTGTMITADYWGSIGACNQINPSAARITTGWPSGWAGTTGSANTFTSYTGSYLCVWECAYGASSYGIYRGQIASGSPGTSTNSIYLGTNTRVIITDRLNSKNCYKFSFAGASSSYFGIPKGATGGTASVSTSGSDTCTNWKDDGSVTRRRLLSLQGANRRLLSGTNIPATIICFGGRVWSSTFSCCYNGSSC